MDNPPLVTSEKPVVYIFHGDDEFAIACELDGLISRMGDPAVANLNITRLDGRQALFAEIHTSAITMPFLAERRLIILTHPLACYQSQKSRIRFQDLLTALPSTTALVLVVEDQCKRSRNTQGQWGTVWKVLNENHWLLDFARKADKRVLIKTFARPQKGAVVAWIQSQADSQGGEIDNNAAQMLGGFLGNDTRLLNQEIIKLLQYVDYKRAVTVKDVEMLTAPIGQENVYKMVDAIGSGGTQEALRMLHSLLEEQDSARMFGMIIRQFRLLLQAREIIDEGGGIFGIQKELNVLPFVAKKLEGQAGRFTIGELESIYQRLLEVDEALKSGQITFELAMDMFIVELER